ncbi:MAG: FAD-dependent oxidoreductase, partial [Thermoplasmata archaeon]
LVCVGASDPRSLHLPGENLSGVYRALPFLLAVNTGPDGLFGRTERRVVVFGGGDVALDAARSARRLAHRGAVTVIYRKARREMSAGEEEVVGGGEEGISFLFDRSPVRIQGAESVEGVVVQQMDPGPPDASGHPTLVPRPGTEETIPCDTVIIAVGEKANIEGFPKELDFTFAAHGWPTGAREDWMTDVEGVFAGGGKSVVYGMAAGYRLAEAVDAYVAKKTGKPRTPRPDPFGGPTPPPPLSGYGGPTWTL